MSPTPDRKAGPSYEEKLILTTIEGHTADAEGEMVYKDGSFSMRDSVGVFNPRSAGGGGSSLLVVSFSSGDSTLGLEGSATDYETKGYVLWPGSSYIGSPVSVKVAEVVEGSGTGYVKIYDVTNALQVAEASFTNTTIAVGDMGTLSNIASGEAIWEIQLKIVGNRTTIHVPSLMVKF